jgi:gamma-glutamylcyclotransferase (GGCT)/AIG2-like uncharacterized protein YtfP
MRLHSYLSDSRFIGNAVVSGEMYDLGRYPAFRVSEDGEVRGEVWEVDSRTLALLDLVEGYDPVRNCGLYLRQEIMATLSDSRRLFVQVYVGNMDMSHVMLVETGCVSDYKVWIERNNP